MARQGTTMNVGPGERRRAVALLMLWCIFAASNVGATSIPLLRRATALRGASLSPDGRKVVYDVAVLPGEPLTRASWLTVRDVADPVSARPIGEGERPQWSPVRDEIAFVAWDHKGVWSEDLWLCDPDGEQRRWNGPCGRPPATVWHWFWPTAQGGDTPSGWSTGKGVRHISW